MRHTLTYRCICHVFLVYAKRKRLSRSNHWKLLAKVCHVLREVIPTTANFRQKKKTLLTAFHLKKTDSSGRFTNMELVHQPLLSSIHSRVKKQIKNRQTLKKTKNKTKLKKNNDFKRTSAFFN